MYFRVNASPPEPLNIAAQTSQVIGHMMKRVLGNILCDLDPKVKVIGTKAGICDGCTVDCCSSTNLFFNVLVAFSLAGDRVECTCKNIDCILFCMHFHMPGPSEDV